MITALVGMLVALKQTHLIGSDLADPIISQSASGSAGPTDAAPKSLSSSSIQTPAHSPPKSIPTNRSMADAATGRTYAVSLPAQREYVRGTIYDKARYVLLSTEVIPRPIQWLRKGFGIVPEILM